MEIFTNNGLKKLFKPIEQLVNVNERYRFPNIQMAYEPIRTNRFVVTFPDVFNIPEYVVSSVNLPSLTNNGWSNMTIVINEVIAPSVIMTLFYNNWGNRFNNSIITFEMLDPVNVSVRKYEISVRQLDNIDLGSFNYSDDGVQTLTLNFSVDNLVVVY